MRTKARIWAPLGVLAALSSAAPAEPDVANDVQADRQSLLHHDIDVEKELLVTATEVVDSPKAEYPGAWSFGHLIEQAYGKEEAPRVVARWLSEWAKGAKGSSSREALPPRPGVGDKLIRPWQEADGFDPKSDDHWLPNLANAPFRLLAISNRLDLSVPLGSIEGPTPRLSGSAYYASSGSLFADTGGGEARLIYAVTDQQGKSLNPGTTIIFEYGLDVLRKKQHTLEWATAWHGLGAHKEFDEFYLADLEDLTRAFTDRRATELPGSELSGATSGRTPVPDLLAKASEVRRGKPLVERLGTGNGVVDSQLLRIRTNEGSFGEVREFRQFNRARSLLVAAALPGTPRESFFRPQTTANKWMTEWVQGHLHRKPAVTVARDELQEKPDPTFAVPPFASTRGSRGAVVAMVAPVPGGNASYHWNGAGVDPHLRHSFSLQTCCGCHCGDTNTEFFHIAPRERGEQAKLSRFLRTDGSTFMINDPAGGYVYPSAEMETRKNVLAKILSQDLDQFQVAEILGETP